MKRLVAAAYFLENREKNEGYTAAPQRAQRPSGFGSTSVRVVGYTVGALWLWTGTGDLAAERSRYLLR